MLDGGIFRTITYIMQVYFYLKVGSWKIIVVAMKIKVFILNP